MNFLSQLFRKTKGRKISDAEEKSIAEKGSEKQRYALALNERASQEILYYLALHDPSEKVRKAVAANPSTPMQASSLLAKDKSDDVRYLIAKRLVKILPSLSQEHYSQLYAFAVQSLGMLALDEVLKIRKAMSETLKDYAQAPPALAAQLARDLEREVAEPILRFCTAVGDDDLIDILQTHPANWAAEAVARRKVLSARVSQAVIDTGNVRAGKMLLSNEGAQITPDLLETIIERAKEYPEWHKPIATRKSLPPLMARKLAAYVDKSVRKILTERSDLDKETIAAIIEIIQRRMEFEDKRHKNIDRTNPIERAHKLNAAGQLTEEAVSDALAMRDKEFVVAAISLAARVSMSDVEKVLDVKAPKTICALCWKAGFSMRLSLKLQQAMAGIKPAALIYPRGGTDYPLTEQEMRWQLDMIGMGAKKP